MAVVYEAVLSERIIFGARRDEVSAKQRQVFLLEQSIQGVGKADIFYQHINTTARPQIFPLLDSSSNENSTYYKFLECRQQTHNHFGGDGPQSLHIS